MAQPVLDLNLPDEAATSALGRSLATVCRPGDLIALTGDLGAGKSTLARALIRELAGAEIDVPSPTFTLVQTYETPRLPVWHFDLYRLETPEQVFELGWEEALAEGISIVEWPERLGPLLPKHLSVTLEVDDDGRRALFDV